MFCPNATWNNKRIIAWIFLNFFITRLHYINIYHNLCHVVSLSMGHSLQVNMSMSWICDVSTVQHDSARAEQRAESAGGGGERAASCTPAPGSRCRCGYTRTWICHGGPSTGTGEWAESSPWTAGGTWLSLCMYHTSTFTLKYREGCRSLRRCSLILTHVAFSIWVIDIAVPLQLLSIWLLPSCDYFFPG